MRGRLRVNHRTQREVRGSRRPCVAHFAIPQNAFDDASAKHRESTLSDSFTYSRRNHGPDCILRFRVLAGGSLGMLQQRGYECAFLRAQNAHVPHQRF
jgi:hypothetical protein